MKKRFLLPLVVMSMLALQCQNTTTDEDTSKDDTVSAANGGAIVPVDLSSAGIDNFKYPQDSNVINGWIKAQDMAKIAQHGWGIWTALNEQTDQVYREQKLRVFETWLTPQEMQKLIKSSDEKLLMQNVKQSRGTLSKPNQFIHATTLRTKAGALKDAQDDAQVVGFVKYDPTAADFTVKNKLLMQSVLQDMLSNGKTEIPEFPTTGMTLKPVFKIITQDSLKKYGGYFKLNVWSGPPATPRAYGEGSWPDYIYIDPKGSSSGNGGVDNGSGRSADNTYGLNDFVHFILDKQTASDLKSGLNIQAKEGDIAVLVAMHVTSKEIKRWTWQTYWWTPDPKNPPAPSSSTIASNMPAQLTGAPAHYAMSQSYSFIDPVQPLTGGTNVGTSIYAYNPYLEAGFDISVLGNKGVVVTNGKRVVNNYGVLTNCMSCHAQANFAPDSVKTAPNYIGDTYIDMEGAEFKNTLKVDFAWSIPGNLIKD